MQVQRRKQELVDGYHEAESPSFDCALPFIHELGNRRLFTACLFFNARERKKRAKLESVKYAGVEERGANQPVKSPVLDS